MGRTRERGAKNNSGGGGDISKKNKKKQKRTKYCTVESVVVYSAATAVAQDAYDVLLKESEH